MIRLIADDSDIQGCVATPCMPCYLFSFPTYQVLGQRASFRRQSRYRRSVFHRPSLSHLTHVNLPLLPCSPGLHDRRAGPISRHADIINGRIAALAGAQRRETWNERGIPRGSACPYGQRAGTRAARRALNGGTTRRRATFCAGESPRAPPYRLDISQASRVRQYGST